MSTLYNIVNHVFKNVGATHVTLKKESISDVCAIGMSTTIHDCQSAQYTESQNFQNLF